MIIHAPNEVQVRPLRIEATAKHPTRDVRLHSIWVPSVFCEYINNIVVSIPMHAIAYNADTLNLDGFLFVFINRMVLASTAARKHNHNSKNNRRRRVCFLWQYRVRREQNGSGGGINIININAH